MSHVSRSKLLSFSFQWLIELPAIIHEPTFMREVRNVALILLRCTDPTQVQRALGSSLPDERHMARSFIFNPWDCHALLSSV